MAVLLSLSMSYGVSASLPGYYRRNCTAKPTLSVTFSNSWLCRNMERNHLMAAGFRAVLTATIILTAGCEQTVPTTANYFPSQLGQAWDMVADKTGDITHFEIVSAPTSDHVDVVNMHITKSKTRAYWQPGSPGAELWWGMHQLQDLRWVADYSIANFDPPNLLRFDYVHYDSNSYMVVPPPGAPPGEYIGYSEDNYCSGDRFCQIPFLKVMWVSRIAYTTVDTPIYTGPAVLNEEYECAQPIDISDIDNPLKCAHELWYFAPNIGLVEIDIKWIALPCDPNCPADTPIPEFPPTIRRIN